MATKTAFWAICFLLCMLVFMSDAWWGKKTPSGKLCEFILNKWETKFVAIINSSDNTFRNLIRGSKEEQARKLDLELVNYARSIARPGAGFADSVADIRVSPGGEISMPFALSEAFRAFSVAIVDCQREKRMGGRDQYDGCESLKNARKKLQKICDVFK